MPNDFKRKKCIKYINENEVSGKLVYIEFTGTNDHHIKSIKGYAPEGEADLLGKLLGYTEIEFGLKDIKSSYKGMYWNGKMNGYGIVTYKDGDVLSGVFKDNEFIKSEKFDLKKIQSKMKGF